jgi:LuxR family transcriptional regulator/LuxR family quorum-sensing system transcriptional regulator CciR
MSFGDDDNTGQTLPAPTLDNGKVVRFSLEIRTCRHTGQLGEHCVEVLDGLGIGMMSYHHLPPPGATDHSDYVEVATHGFPEEWARRYQDEQLYRIDPIPKHALDACWPFFWSEVGEHMDLTQDQQRYLRMLDQQNLGDGLAIAVFGPHGRNGYVGLGGWIGRAKPDNAQISALQMIAQMAHLRYCELLVQKLPSYARLSEREREILVWIAKGKSNGVMAEILDLSPNTVDTYVRRVFRKLHVGDRVTAALRGVALGLIS